LPKRILLFGDGVKLQHNYKNITSAPFRWPLVWFGGWKVTKTLNLGVEYKKKYRKNMFIRGNRLDDFPEV